MEDLVSEKKVNKKKIKKSMMDMVFLQIISRLNNEFPVRRIFIISFSYRVCPNL
jgi:hypothetical protein